MGRKKMSLHSQCTYHTYDYQTNIIQMKLRAIDDFNKLIELNPEGGDAFVERGLIKMRMGDKDGGCRDFSKAGELGEAYAYEMIKKYCN